MPVTKEVHFVARILVEKVEKVTEATNSRGYTDTDLPAKVGEVTTTEIAGIQIKDNDLDNLKGRLTAHIGLVEDL